MTVRALAGWIALAGLALTIGPPVLYLIDTVEKDHMKHLMLVGSALWFVAAPFWTGGWRR